MEKSSGSSKYEILGDEKSPDEHTRKRRKLNDEQYSRTSKIQFFSGITPSVDEKELEKEINGRGKFGKLKIQFCRKDNKYSKCAYVEFDSLEDSKKFQRETNGEIRLNGVKSYCIYSNSKIMPKESYIQDCIQHDLKTIRNKKFDGQFSSSYAPSFSPRYNRSRLYNENLFKIPDPSTKKESVLHISFYWVGTGNCSSTLVRDEISTDYIYNFFQKSKYGLEKIVIFEKKNDRHPDSICFALLNFENEEKAAIAVEKFQGAVIDGKYKMNIQFSKITELKVQFNDRKIKDFTKDLPSKAEYHDKHGKDSDSIDYDTVTRNEGYRSTGGYYSDQYSRSSSDYYNRDRNDQYRSSYYSRGSNRYPSDRDRYSDPYLRNRREGYDQMSYRDSRDSRDSRYYSTRERNYSSRDYPRNTYESQRGERRDERDRDYRGERKNERDRGDYRGERRDDRSRIQRDERREDLLKELKELRKLKEMREKEKNTSIDSLLENNDLKQFLLKKLLREKPKDKENERNQLSTLTNQQPQQQNYHSSNSYDNQSSYQQGPVPQQGVSGSQRNGDYYQRERERERRPITDQYSSIPLSSGQGSGYQYQNQQRGQGQGQYDQSYGSQKYGNYPGTTGQGSGYYPDNNPQSQQGQFNRRYSNPNNSYPSYHQQPNQQYQQPQQQQQQHQHQQLQPQQQQGYSGNKNDYYYSGNNSYDNNQSQMQPKPRYFNSNYPSSSTITTNKSPVILVNNLDELTTCDELFSIFSLYGDVIKVKVLKYQTHTSSTSSTSRSTSSSTTNSISNKDKVYDALLNPWEDNIPVSSSSSKEGKFRSEKQSLQKKCTGFVQFDNFENCNLALHYLSSSSTKTSKNESGTGGGPGIILHGKLLELRKSKNWNIKSNNSTNPSTKIEYKAYYDHPQNSKFKDPKEISKKFAHLTYPSKRLLFYNVDQSVPSQTLLDIISNYGKVTVSNSVRENTPGNKKIYFFGSSTLFGKNGEILGTNKMCIIEFETLSQAIRVIVKLTGKMINGRALQITFAHNQRKRKFSTFNSQYSSNVNPQKPNPQLSNYY